MGSFVLRSPKLAELDPCLAWVRREAESGGKERQVRRPFHLDYYFLRIQTTRMGTTLWGKTVNWRFSRWIDALNIPS
jgi:hypothetical protein